MADSRHVRLEWPSCAQICPGEDRVLPESTRPVTGGAGPARGALTCHNPCCLDFCPKSLLRCKCLKTSRVSVSQKLSFLIRPGPASPQRQK